jgi:hypothetical protein
MELDTINTKREIRELELKIQQERLKKQREQPVQDYVNTHNLDGTPRTKP